LLTQFRVTDRLPWAKNLARFCVAISAGPLLLSAAFGLVWSYFAIGWHKKPSSQTALQQEAGEATHFISTQQAASRPRHRDRAGAEALGCCACDSLSEAIPAQTGTGFHIGKPPATQNHLETVFLGRVGIGHRLAFDSFADALQMTQQRSNLCYRKLGCFGGNSKRFVPVNCDASA
jgi:hypothetical protein